MRAEFELFDQKYKVNLNHPLDISIPLRAEEDNPKAWYVDAPVIEPVRGEGFVGAVNQGGSVNFRNISFNPHGHGTHTECVGHISRQVHSINMHLKKFFFMAKVHTVEPTTIQSDESEYRKKGDRVIFKEDIEAAFNGEKFNAIVLRTLPNDAQKLTGHYSNSNFPYLDQKAAAFLVANEIEHLLIDLPSIDREVDGGQLIAHKTFWNYPKSPRFFATITEFIYVKESIQDGLYLLNLQIAPFVNDASPSKPILYEVL
ncbi:MAG: cyclase family protein [Bacteroidota bacterium]